MMLIVYRNKIQQLSQKISLKMRTFSTSGNGDIRGAGGAFGKKEKAQEEQYFRQKEKEELSQFKKKLEENKNEKKPETKNDKPAKK